MDIISFSLCCLYKLAAHVVVAQDNGIERGEKKLRLLHC